MSISGYSDRINHAFAFAAKHHAQQVWKGTSRVPYFTYPANRAVILTRYGQDEDTVVAGILYDVVADSRRDGSTIAMVRERLAPKFGDDVLETLVAITERSHDADGVELAIDERKDDLLERLADANVRGRWVLATTVVQSGGSLAADLRRTEYPEHVWQRMPMGRNETIRWYSRMHDRLAEVGFDTPIMTELRQLIAALESSPAVEPASVTEVRGR